MEIESNKDRRNPDQKLSLEKLIDAIDQKVDQVPALPTAERFAAFLGGQAEDYHQPGEQYVRFTIAGTTFAIPMNNTLEIDYVPEIIPLPNTPKWVLGICNMRGDIVSVVDIHQVLNLVPGDVDRLKKLVLVKSNDVSTAIMVDRVSGMLFMKHKDKLRNSPAASKKTLSKFVKNVVILDRQTVHLLDLDALMAAIKI